MIFRSASDASIATHDAAPPPLGTTLAPEDSGFPAADGLIVSSPDVRPSDDLSPRPVIAGVDEAGRGPLAGPVVVAAVVFDPDRPRLNRLGDSKQLTAARREALYPRIVERALAWRIVFVDVDEIDRLNIFHATMLGMQRAVEGVTDVLGSRPCVARIDGNHLPKSLPCHGEAWIDGDARDRAIMAASILAKVARDRHMLRLHDAYPHYGFAAHKGYSTAAHLAALREHGPCPHHRRSFAPVRMSETSDTEGRASLHRVHIVATS